MSQIHSISPTREGGSGTIKKEGKHKYEKCIGMLVYVKTFMLYLNMVQHDQNITIIIILLYLLSYKS